MEYFISYNAKMKGQNIFGNANIELDYKIDSYELIKEIEGILKESYKVDYLAILYYKLIT